MQAFCIVVKGSEQSEAGFAKLKESHEAVGNEFPLEAVPATTPKNVEKQMERYCVRWAYPWDRPEQRADLRMVLHPYKTRNRLARMACFMSHYRLWRMHLPILILEDDALFIRRLDPEPLLASEFHAIGINDPRGATRLPGVFHSKVQAMEDEIGPSPWIDAPEVPQGLAGASAYIIKPDGAAAAVALTDSLGAWPNDALLCRQLCPWLGVTKTYYTKVQGTPTTL